MIYIQNIYALVKSGVLQYAFLAVYVNELFILVFAIVEALIQKYSEFY